MTIAIAFTSSYAALAAAATASSARVPRSSDAAGNRPGTASRLGCTAERSREHQPAARPLVHEDPHPVRSLEKPLLLVVRERIERVRDRHRPDERREGALRFAALHAEVDEPRAPADEPQAPLRRYEVGVRRRPFRSWRVEMNAAATGSDASAPSGPQSLIVPLSVPSINFVPNVVTAVR
jgi:hypothetical protein